MTARTLNKAGTRICPLGCGPTVAQGPDGTRQHTCRFATSKSAPRPGEREFTPPLPGKCRMFYDEKGEPT